VSLLPPLKVGKLQAALHTKAKNAPDYRFYAVRRGPLDGRIDGARYRARQWLCVKFKVSGQGKTRYPDHYLSGELTLHQLQQPKRNNRSCANV